MIVAKYFMVVLFVGLVFFWGATAGHKLNIGKSSTLEAPCSSTKQGTESHFKVNPVNKTCFFGHKYNVTVVDCKTVLLLEEFSDVRHCFP